MGLGGEKTTRGTGSVLLAIVVAIIAIAVTTNLSARQPWDDSLLKDLARSHREWVFLQRNNNNNGTLSALEESSPSPPSSAPLDGVVILVTGSTSGIGRSLVRWTFQQGATIVAMGRSTSKLKALQDELVPQENDQTRFFSVVADMADLNSVSASVDVLQTTLSQAAIPKIDIVVCNAGVWVPSDDNDPPPSTVQGYDLTFGVNYLSHVLLTEKLMRIRSEDGFLLSKKTSRIVQVSSSFNQGVDGKGLAVVGDTSPIASRISESSTGFGVRNLLEFVFRGQRQYANSKLAQLLHARAVNRRYFEHPGGLDDENRVYVPFVSACPAWVGTHILRAKLENESWMERVFHTLSFDVDGYGLSSILKSMFAPLSNGDNTSFENADYFTNFGGILAWLGYTHDRIMVAMDSVSVSLLGEGEPSNHAQYLRDMGSSIGCFFVLVAQHSFKTNDVLFTYKSSIASYNRDLQNELHEWSLEAIDGFL